MTWQATFVTLGLIAGATASAGGCSSASGTTTSGATTASSTTSTGSGSGGACGATSTTTSTGSAGGGACYPDDAGGTKDTWSNFAQGFFSTYCVECHSATVPNPAQDPKQNFNLLADVVPFKDEIRCGVTPANLLQCGCSRTTFPPPGQFPIGNTKPDDAERLRIVAWIDADCPP